MSALLLGRSYFGFGDWVMLSTVVRMINSRFPYLQVDLDATRIPPQKRWLANILFEHGCRVRLVQPDPLKSTAYDLYCPNVTYRRHRGDGHLLQGMCDTVTADTGLDLQYGPDTPLANCVGDVGVTNHLPYVVLISRGSEYQGSAIKDPAAGNGGPAWWDKLAGLLKPQYKVVQVAYGDDPPLRNATVHRNLNLPDLTRLLRECEFTVCIENGLMHLAGHNSVPCYPIFCSNVHARPANAYYPNQVPLDYEGLRPTPEEIAERLPATGQTAIKVI